MPRRRATDRPPLSDVVTRGNLDDRLDTLIKMLEAHDQFSAEQWNAHRAVHEAVAESLRDYKRDANEWRTSLTDLRSTFIPKAEYQAEHRALDAKLHGEVEKVSGKFDTLDTRVDVLASDMKDMNTEHQARRSVFSDGRNIMVAVSLLFGIIASGLLLLDRIRP